MNTKLKEARGFTIIEVLIVLAIAGLILLIVFLAVPALQRNSRNTQRRNDVSSILGKLQEVANNNNGKLHNTGPITNEPDIILEGLGFYTGTGSDDWATVDYRYVATGANSITTPIPDNSTVIIRNNYKCNSSGANAYVSTPVLPAAATIVAGDTTANVVTTTGATLRTIVAVFAVESNGNNVQLQCVEA